MAIRKETDDLIAFLNSLVAIDPYAMAELLQAKASCNREMAEHPTVQVDAHGKKYTHIAPGTYRVGLLGILNGFCGAIDEGPRKGWGPIVAVYEPGHLVRFERAEDYVTPPCTGMKEGLPE